MSQGMAVSNYKADEKEAQRNRKTLLALVKMPHNNICAACPAKRACHRELVPCGWRVQ